ncbi:MAG: hypothetical protein ACHQZQ_06145 [SAR324 cluster bacterium]
MPSQSRAFEASFEPFGKSPVPPGPDTTPALEDFDAFFEKLNSPDPLGWNSAHPANPERKAPAGAAPNPPAAKAAAGAAVKPSRKADALAGLRAAAVQAGRSQTWAGAQSSGQAPPPPKRRGASGAFRFAATAFILFIVGMGIGWAALSLPGKMTGDTATIVPVPARDAQPQVGREAQTANGLVIEPKVALPADGRFDVSSRKRPQAGHDASSDRMASIVPLTEVTPGPASPDIALPEPAGGTSSSADTAEKSSGHVAADSTAQQAARGDGTEAPGSAGQPAQTGGMIGATAQPGSALAVSAKHSAHRTASRKPGRQAQPAAAATAAEAGSALSTEPGPAQDAPAASPQTAIGPRYAVQVGACRSTRCIENYRALIATHLPANAGNIRVIPVPADHSGVQRVRVAPLERSEAQQLRLALIQADPRLGKAYVVAVHP